MVNKNEKKLQLTNPTQWIRAHHRFPFSPGIPHPPDVAFITYSSPKSIPFSSLGILSSEIEHPKSAGQPLILHLFKIMNSHALHR